MKPSASLSKSNPVAPDQVRMAEHLRFIQASPAVPAPISRARLGDVSAADSLVELMGHSEVQAERYEAARLLLRLPPQLSTLPKLLQLRIGEPGLNAWRSVAALRLGHRPARRHVEQILQSSTGDFELRLRASEVVAWRRIQGLTPALLKILEDCPNIESCRQAIGVLSQLGDRNAVPALVNRLSNPMVQREVIRALGRLGGPESITALGDCLLRDERSLARVEAARALGAIGGPLIKPTLTQAAMGDPELIVRKTALAVLQSPSVAQGNVQPAAGQ